MPTIDELIARHNLVSDRFYAAKRTGQVGPIVQTLFNRWHELNRQWQDRLQMEEGIVDKVNIFTDEAGLEVRIDRYTPILARIKQLEDLGVRLTWDLPG